MQAGNAVKHHDGRKGIVTFVQDVDDIHVYTDGDNHEQWSQRNCEVIPIQQVGKIMWARAVEVAAEQQAAQLRTTNYWHQQYTLKTRESDGNRRKFQKIREAYLRDYTEDAHISENLHNNLCRLMDVGYQDIVPRLEYGDYLMEFWAPADAKIRVEFNDMVVRGQKHGVAFVGEPQPMAREEEE